MTGTYLASSLPEDEYIVLDCLCTAHSKGETPISLAEFHRAYELLSEVAADVFTLDAVLKKLNEKRLVGQDFRGLWLPTKYGQDVAQFKENTRA